MRIVFFGTGKFGLPSLKKLLESDHEIVAVVTQPDRKKGRGWNIQASPVKAFIEQAAPAAGVLQPVKASDRSFISSLRERDTDLFVVIDYGQILSREVLDIPKKYCINLHPSLLPKYRGASPVNWTVINGESETGNTVIKIDERMDAGEVIMQEKLTVAKEDDAEVLLDKLSLKGVELLIKALEEIESGTESFSPQDESAASYAPKLKKEDGQIDWSLTSSRIICKTKGLKPWPVAFTYLEGKTLKILEAEDANNITEALAPGTICDKNEFIVKTGDGAIKINKLQMEGKRVMPSSEFLKGYRTGKGIVLG
ncbi:MAG: methionyl-tRNA formyltransferase [Candidatus Omnitrophica bacterium]|nr:methionyl-tRNA formyltransferase [Candidatus Omnitrophota bacterium]